MCQTLADGRIKTEWVGYYFSKDLNDSVFVLPKVILNEQDKVLGEYLPEDIVNTSLSSLHKNGITDHREFLYNFSVWIYRALQVYHERYIDSPIIRHQHYSNVDRSGKSVQITILDILLSLLKFAQENRDYLKFRTQLAHSNNRRIDWRNTIRKTMPFVQNGSPVYAQPLGNRKVVDYDEELLIIFYSILDYISNVYGFRVMRPEFNFELINLSKFQAYIKGLGKRRLLAIKYKYFSDIDLKLWNLCFAFFDMLEKVNSNSVFSDYLLVNNFEAVFEDIIDKLIGDPNCDGLKVQDDGKIVDHLYKERSLISDNEIYYIGDSKYYKIDAPFEEKSIPKQYTYAKNIIQLNFNWLFRNEEADKQVNYRDKATEGYNITPNFFICGKIDKDYLQYSDDKLDYRSDDTQIQFRNRLFDRDSLILTRYNVNFLFVLLAYCSRSVSRNENFRNKARKSFREKITDYLCAHYHFFSFTFISHGDLRLFVNSHFRQLLGKMFCPVENGKELILAFEKGNYVFNDETSIQYTDNKLAIGGLVFSEYGLR